MMNRVAHILGAGRINYVPSAFANRYWSIWAEFGLIAGTLLLGSFLYYEFWSLAHGHPENTLSAQVWYRLKVQPVPVDQWSAIQVLTLILWLVMWLFVFLIAAWLTGHFWFLKWR